MVDIGTNCPPLSTQLSTQIHASRTTLIRTMLHTDPAETRRPTFARPSKSQTANILLLQYSQVQIRVIIIRS